MKSLFFVLFFKKNISNIDEKYFEKCLKQPLPFDNTEYELRISGSVETDQRLMSFIDVLWGFEVTGGYDQYEPLTVIDVNGFVPVGLTNAFYIALNMGLLLFAFVFPFLLLLRLFSFLF